jgi:hypothetical protein
MPFSGRSGRMRRNPEVISKVMEKREIVGIFRRMALFGRIAAGRGAVRASVGALLAHAALRPSPCMAFAVPGEPLSDPSRSGGADDAASSEAAGRDARPLVLVAEDNAGNYRLIEVILRSAYRLQHALNGQEAVEMFDRERPDIVLMDINMPVMDGYEALRLIRERDTKVPVIALTAYAFDSDLQKMLECGFDSCMTKPINVGGIKALIESQLHK